MPANPVINWGHPLAQGLTVCVTFNEGSGKPVDLVSGQPLILNSGTGWIWEQGNVVDPESGAYFGACTDAATGATGWRLDNRDGFDSDDITVSFNVLITVPDNGSAVGATFGKNSGSTNHWGIFTSTGTPETAQFGFFSNNQGKVASGVTFAEAATFPQRQQWTVTTKAGNLTIVYNGSVRKNQAYTVGTLTTGNALWLADNRGLGLNCNTRITHMYAYCGTVHNLDSTVWLNEDPYAFLEANVFRRHFSILASPPAAAASLLPRRNPLAALIVR